MKGCLIAFVCTGCSDVGSETIAPYLPPSQLLVQLRLDEKAYNMALTPPYNTVQLNATGYSGTGDIFEGIVEYSVALSAQDKMTVSPTGLLTVTGTGTDMILYARMTHNGATLVDSAYVNVVTEAPSRLLKRVGFELFAPQDSAKTAVGYAKYWKIVGKDDIGGDVPGIRVHTWSSDSSIGRVLPRSRRSLRTGSEWSVLGMRPGKMIVHVSTFAFGVSMKDSLVFQVGWPVTQPWVTTSARFDLKTSNWFMDFDQKRIVIGTGGCVRWSNNYSDLPVDITFDDPSAAAPPSVQAWVMTGIDRASNLLEFCAQAGSLDDNGGNIAPFTPRFNDDGSQVVNSQFRARTFPRPGIYKYRSRLYGTEGVVVVCDESFDDPVCDPDSYSWIRL